LHCSGESNEIPVHGVLDEKKLEALSASELHALDDESLAYHDREGRPEYGLTHISPLPPADTTELGNGVPSGGQKGLQSMAV
jgi:hypothetical protein